MVLNKLIKLKTFKSGIKALLISEFKISIIKELSLILKLIELESENYPNNNLIN